MNFGQLTPMLAPKSVAIVGASERIGNLGGVALDLLNKFNFKGNVWAINSKYKTVFGRDCFESFHDLPAIPDVAILAIPAAKTIEVIEECGKAGVRSVIIWAGGFAEIQGAGVELQKKLASICNKYAIQLCGPNCLGVVNMSIGFTGSFGSMLGDISNITSSDISMVSQSGGMSGIASLLSQQLGFGFRLTISSGNEAVVTVADYIKALCRDDGTNIIAVYIESITDHKNFIEAVSLALANKKTVVAMKAGASMASSRAATAHTGKLAGSDAAFEAVFREFAIIRVWSIEEMLDTCMMLSTFGKGKQPKGTNIVMTTFGGGSGVLATDLCSMLDLNVPNLSKPTESKLQKLLTPLASIKNPIDLTPQSINDPHWRELLPEALKLILEDKNIDMFMFMAGGMGHRKQELISIISALNKCTKPLAVSWMAPPSGLRRQLADMGVFLFEEHARAVRTLATITKMSLEKEKPIRITRRRTIDFDWTPFQTAKQKLFPENAVATMMEAAKLNFAKGVLIKRNKDLDQGLLDVGFPLAAKGISPDHPHRAQSGLLALNVMSKKAVISANKTFKRICKETGSFYEGMWLQQMHLGGVELIFSALREDEFGTLIGCGIGGSQTEMINDAIFARSPVSTDSARNMISSLRCLVNEQIKMTSCQLCAASEYLSSFSQFVCTIPFKKFSFELNPVKIYDDQAIAVDGLLVINEP